MFERSGVSLAREIIILAGVVLLFTSVFHAVLMWLALISLGVGLSLLVVACLESLLPSKSSSCASLAVPAAGNPHKES